MLQMDLSTSFRQPSCIKSEKLLPKSYSIWPAVLLDIQHNLAIPAFEMLPGFF